MAKTIYKYEIQLGRNEVKMPKGAQILTCQMQGETLNVWAIVSPNSGYAEEIKVITVYGTGHPLPNSMSAVDWIATVQDSPYVWHVFEIS